MSWAIHEDVWDAKKYATAKIQEKLEERAENTVVTTEGGFHCGKANVCHFYNEILSSEEEAKEFLEEHYRKYSDGAVRFKKAAEPTKKAKDLMRKIENVKQTAKDFAAAHSVSTFKADFIGCKGCGSKIAKKFISNDRCPLCRTDLRSETTRKTMDEYKNHIDVLQKRLDEEEKKNNEKAGDIYWLTHQEIYIG